MSACWCGKHAMPPYPEHHDTGECMEIPGLPVQERLTSPVQVTVYLQHIIREFLLENVGAWKQARDVSEVSGDRSELGMVIDQAESLAKALLDANVCLIAAESPIHQAPFIQLPGRA